MKTVQMTLDEATVAEVDKAVKRLGTTRSAFTRQALREALARLETSLLEEKQRRGYLKRPVTRGEFSAWEWEQVWEEE
jgi:metal-responsive CopG/Arc/MetJ family transcriptional regulator